MAAVSVFGVHLPGTPRYFRKGQREVTQRWSHFFKIGLLWLISPRPGVGPFGCSHSVGGSFGALASNGMDKLCGHAVGTMRRSLLRPCVQGNLMTGVSTECRDAKNANQMKRGTWQLSPRGHKEAPHVFGYRRSPSRGTTRACKKYRKPRVESFPISFEQRSPADHIDLHPLAGKELLHGRISHKSIGLGEMWQHAHRSARHPAQKPSNGQRQHTGFPLRGDAAVVVSVGFQAVGAATVWASRGGHHLRMTAANDVRFRVSIELENDLHGFI